MSNEKSTVEFAPPPEWAIALTEKVNIGFQAVHSRLDSIERNQDVQGAQAVDMGKRLTTVEERIGKLETRQNEGSIRARAATENDAAQDAAIAKIIETQDAHEKKLDALSADVAGLKTTIGEIKALVSGLFENPKVRFVGRVIFVLAAAYAAGKGIKVLP